MRRAAPSAEFGFVAACLRRPLDPARMRHIVACAGAVADWPAVLAIAGRQRVVALVFQACHEAGVTIPPDTAGRFAEAAKAATGEALRLAFESVRLQRLLEEAGVPVAFLKGTALAVLAYGQAGLRHSKDIDLLIDPLQYRAATECLQAAGYVPQLAKAPSPGERHTLSLLNSRSEEWRHPGQNIELELHWKPTDLLLLTGMAPTPQVQLVPVLAGMRLRTLQQEDLLAYLCVHGGAHAWSRLKWLADIYALLPNQEPVEVERFYRGTATRDVGRTCGQALLLCRRIFGLELPEVLLAELQRDWPLRLAVLLAETVLTRGAGVVEMYDLPFGTSVVYLSRFLLGCSWGFVRAELRNLFRPREALTGANRRRLSTPVAVLLRLGHWIAARWRHGGRSSSPWGPEKKGLERSP